jgi:hypothetical protein
MRGRAFARPKSAAPAGRAVSPNRKLSLGDAGPEEASLADKVRVVVVVRHDAKRCRKNMEQFLRLLGANYVECEWLDDEKLDPIAYDVVILRSDVERLANYRCTRSLTFAVDTPPPNGPAIGAGAEKPRPSRPKPKPRPTLVAPPNPVYQPGQRVRYVDPTPGVVDQSHVGTG